MPNYNRVTLIGHLTRDPEIRYTSSNKPIAGIGLAVNDTPWKDAAGNKQEYVNFFDCDAFGAQAEALSKYVRKGDPILVDGVLKQERWEKDGHNRSKVVVKVMRFEFLKSREVGTDPHSSTHAPVTPPTPQPAEVKPDEIPF